MWIDAGAQEPTCVWWVHVSIPQKEGELVITWWNMPGVEGVDGQDSW